MQVGRIEGREGRDCSPDFTKGAIIVFHPVADHPSQWSLSVVVAKARWMEGWERQGGLGDLLLKFRFYPNKQQVADFPIASLEHMLPR